MNIRVSKLYQGSEWGALEVAFNADPEGDRMIAEIIEVTGLPFKRPPANVLALRELHIAEVGGEEGGALGSAGADPSCRRAAGRLPFCRSSPR